MAQLVFLDGPEPGRTVDLSDGLRIGRLPSCEVVLNHPSISRQHAAVEVRADGIWVVDQESRNGLRVAGQRVREVLAEDGLEFAIGGVEVKFAVDAGPQEVLDEDFDFDESEPDGGGGAIADDGLLLEDPAEIELASTDVTPRERSKAPAPGADPRPAAPAATSQPAPNPVAERDERRAEVVRQVSSEPAGLLRGDLSQFPGWIQGLVWLGLLGFVAAMAWGAFALIQGAKG